MVSFLVSHSALRLGPFPRGNTLYFTFLSEIVHIRNRIPTIATISHSIESLVVFCSTKSCLFSPNSIRVVKIWKQWPSLTKIANTNVRWVKVNHEVETKTKEPLNMFRQMTPCFIHAMRPKEDDRAFEYGLMLFRIKTSFRVLCWSTLSGPKQVNKDKFVFFVWMDV